MSFANKTKSSLCAVSDTLKHDCCRRAELYGILFSAGVFSRERIKLITSSEELAALTVKRLRELHQVQANLYITDKKSGDMDERRSCKITVVQKRDLERLFHGFRYTDGNGASGISRDMFKCQGCMTAFIRGMFLSAGTITDPEKGYHLEMCFTSQKTADGCAEVLSEAGFAPKRVTRKTELVLYYKDSETIEGFLASIGANAAAFSIMNKKIERELRSDANRLANSELANIGKTVAAAGGQLAAINALRERGELERMPEELKVTAYLRLDNPDATLATLAALHDPPITKSGVNHRLKKISLWKA